MPAWVAILLCVSVILTWPPFLYAKHLAKRDGDKNALPTLWFVGLVNLIAVLDVLKEHAGRGDAWAARGRIAYLVGVALVPLMILGLGMHQYVTGRP